MLFHEIETERLWLRNISCDDREFLYEHFSNQEVTRFLYDAEPFTDIREVDELLQFYMCEEPRGQHRWILVLKENGAKIGTCGFHRYQVNTGTTEVGYDMAHNYQGRGLMTEAMRAILAFAKEEMKVAQVEAHIFPGNERSRHLADKLGFAFEGDTTIYTFRGEDYVHHIYRKRL